MEQKSKLVAYLLWLFLGALGAHKFYVGKVGMGVVYLFTMGLFGVGLLIDLFTLGTQVDVANAVANNKLGGAGMQNQQSQNIVVNVGSNDQGGGSSEKKLSPEKEILKLTEEKTTLSLNDVVNGTSLDMDDAERTLEKMASRGLLDESVDESGRKRYSTT